MRNYVFLFIFIFSPIIIASGMVGGHHGKMEIDKIEDSFKEKNIKTISKNIEDELTEKLSNWQTAVGTYYNPMDSSQTKKNPDGIGASGRKISKGSIAFAFGPSFTKQFIRDTHVFLEIKNCNVITPYGKGIFRVDDLKNIRFNDDNTFYIDFNYQDINSVQKEQGVFLIEFKIKKITKSTNI